MTMNSWNAWCAVAYSVAGISITLILYVALLSWLDYARARLSNEQRGLELERAFTEFETKTKRWGENLAASVNQSILDIGERVDTTARRIDGQELKQVGFDRPNVFKTGM